MFSWSSSGTKTTSRINQYPGQRLNNARSAGTAIEGSIKPPPSSITRAQHLKSYLEDATLQRSTRRVSADDTTYDTVFQTTKGDTLILRVNLPLASSFASSCPAMSLAGVRARHPWLERHSRITGYSPIQSQTSWNSSGLLLGNAVHAVVKHLQLNPPEILEITDQGLRSIQTKPQYQQQPASMNGSSNRNSSTSPRRNGSNASSTPNGAPPSYDAFANLPPAPDVPMPSIPTSHGEVENMSREELEAVMDDELEFLSLVHKLDSFQNIQDIRSEKLVQNVAMAKANLENEEKIKTVASEVKQLQATLKDKVAAFQDLEKKQNALCAPPDKRGTVKQLTRAAREAMDESEEIAEDFVENGGNIDSFVKTFIERRKVHHIRAAKAELLTHQDRKEI